MCTTMRHLWIGALFGLLLLGCGDDGPGDNQNQSQCLAGYRADGPACVPIFDDPDSCGAPNEMPVLGGGCRAVGVTRCATGFLSDGEGGCEPILPDHACPPGTMEMIGQTECQPVGVTQCAEGFVPDGEGGCDAILPAEECPPGTIEVIGYDTCQPLGDCGPEGSPWGVIAVDETTVYVDASADATGADGTVAAPFTTVAAALAVVEPGGQVAIAAGEYEEVLALDKPVRLVGRCSALVTLCGRVQVQPRPALRITSGGTGSEVRGLTLTGPGEGLQVSGAQQVVVEEVEVRNSGSFGVTQRDDAEITLRRVKLAGCTTLGVVSQDSSLLLDQTVVQGTLPQPGTNEAGGGVQAMCSHPGACGRLSLTRSLVKMNREVGVLSTGVDLEVTSSVVMDTLAEQSTLGSGAAIIALCDKELHLCGSLQVEGSLIAGNRDFGILAEGVEVSLALSTIRDTLPVEGGLGSDLNGRGINVQCAQELAVCGVLRVDRSLITRSREVGIFAEGVDVSVLTSVVKDTLPRQRDHDFGRGVSAECDTLLGVCGRLQVESSLISGNHDLGIFAGGVEASVHESMVRDTRSRERDLAGGRGISVQCYEDRDLCGSLLLDATLVTRSHEVGIFAWGADAVVSSSVVGELRSEDADLAQGEGIVAQCNPRICGTLSVEDSLITQSRGFGIYTSGYAATVIASVVSETLPALDGPAFGRGINAQCNEPLTECGTLRVEGSLVMNNSELGIHTAGVDVTVLSSAVHDSSFPNEHRGINAQCAPALVTCPRLNVEGSQVSGYHGGIIGMGADVTLASSVVKGRQATEGNAGSGSRGIHVQCSERTGACGRLVVTDSLVIHQDDIGVAILGVPAALLGIAVIDTQADSSDSSAAIHGQGIWALCDTRVGTCAELAMTNGLVSSSHSAGLALEGISGFMASSVVDTVQAQPMDNNFGYGIQIGGREGEAIPTFHVRECVVRDARLAGVLYYRSEGTLSGSVVSGSEYCVAMNEGSAPTFTADNYFSCSDLSEPGWVTLVPSPAPPPAPPVLPGEDLIP